MELYAIILENVTLCFCQERDFDLTTLISFPLEDRVLIFGRTTFFSQPPKN